MRTWLRKKIRIIGCAMVIVALVSGGCKQQTTNEPATSAVTTDQETEVTQTQPIQQDTTVNATSEPEDALDPNNMVPVEGLRDVYEYVDYHQVIPENAMCTGLDSYGENVLFGYGFFNKDTGDYEDFELLWNPYKKEKIKEIEIYIGTVCKNRLRVFENDHGVVVYDENLEEIDSYDLNGLIDTIYDISGLYSLTEDFPVYFTKYAGEELYRLDRVDEELVLTTPDTGYVGVLISEYIPETQALCMSGTETGKFRNYDFMYDGNETKPCKNPSGVMYEWIMQEALNNSEYVLINFCRIGETNEYLLQVNQESESEMKLLVWDATRTLEEGSAPSWEPDEPSSNENAPSEGEEGAMEPLEGQIEELEPLYEQAAQLGEKYGAHIYIADQVPDEVTGYQLSQSLDYETIAMALERVEANLSLYPKDFFQQLLVEDLEEFDIYISANIHSEDSNNLTEAGALATVVGTQRIMVLATDEIWNWSNDFQHETFHMIETRLNLASVYMPESTYDTDVWNAMNPEGFEYEETYATYPDVTWDDSWSWYFISPYSTTYGHEDRAEVYGTALSAYLEGWDMGNYAPDTIIGKKFQFLVDSIMTSFDTSNWSEDTMWSKALEKAAGSVMY